MNKPTLFFFFFCLLQLSACHRHSELTSSPFKHFFDDNNLVELNIETDMAQLLIEEEDPKYQPARLILKKANCVDEHFHLKIKPRVFIERPTALFRRCASVSPIRYWKQKG